jgi:DNA-binding CsgD family transcriptional regulator
LSRRSLDQLGQFASVSGPLRRDDADLGQVAAQAVRQLRSLRDQHLPRLVTHQRRLALVTAGKMNKQVAGELGLSEITVKVHRGTLMRKMGIRTLADLVKLSEQLAVSSVGAGPKLPRNPRSDEMPARRPRSLICGSEAKWLQERCHTSPRRKRRHSFGARIQHVRRHQPFSVARIPEIVLIEVTNPLPFGIGRAVFGQFKPHQSPRTLIRHAIADEKHMSE